MVDSSNNTEEDLDALKNMAYHSSYTEDINLRMRVPQTITVIPSESGPEPQYSGKSYPKLPMQVPDRIVCSVGESGTEYTQGELPIIPPSQYMTSEDVPLRPPPRVLTVQHQDLDLGEKENGTSGSKNEYIMVTQRNPSSLDISHNSSSNPANIGNIEDIEDTSLLRRQIYKMHQRLTYLEQQEALRLTRDYWVYGVAAAVLVFNGFAWLTQRR